MARETIELPTGPAKAKAVRSMFDSIASRYDALNRVMTFGMDRGWRRRAAGTLGLREGSTVLDIACGTGDFLLEAKRRDWFAVGVDFSREMLLAAQKRGFSTLVQADGLALPLESQSVDGVTCGFALRNVSDLAAMFDEVARVLKPGGRFAFLETSEPSSPILKAGFKMYFNHVVPFIGGLVSDRDAYAYLPRSVAYLPAPLILQTMLERSGFVDVHRLAHFGGVVQTLIGSKP
ncbi:MAG: ubiquinone/menaquinone biosynthesis methyltransferase [Actinomycetota bacterium]